MSYYCRFAFSFGALVLPLSGLADTQKNPLQNSSDSQVIVISGSRESTALRQTPAPINKVAQDTLEEKKPTFVGQVLNQAPGVYVTDLGNEQHSMSIRQPLSYSAVYLYMEDGIPIRPVGLFNHNALYEMNLEGVGSIEVLKGPASSLYGSNAVGGAVNFFTREPSVKPSASVGLQASDQGYRRAAFEASGTQQDQSLLVAGYQSQRRDGWQEHNDADKDSITLRHDWAVNEQSALKTIVSYNRLWTDMPGTLNESDYQNNPGKSYNTFTWRKVEASRFSSALEGNWNNDGLTTFTVYARDNTTDQLPSYLIFNTGPSTAAGRTTFQSFTSYGFEARHRQDFYVQNLRWINGLSIERTPMSATERNLDISRDPLTLQYLSYQPGSLRRDYEVDISSQPLFSQLEYTPTTTLRFLMGARYDHIEYDYRNALTPSKSTGAPSESRQYSHVSPKVGAVWDYSLNTNIYSNLSQGFTPPEVSAQYGGSQSAPNLEEAVFNNADIGMRWRNNARTLNTDVSLYRLEGKNEIISYSIQPGVSEPRNAGRTRHQGIEFGVRYSPNQPWDAAINGTLAQHRFEDYQVSSTQNFSGNDIPASPKWLVNTELGYKPLPLLRLSAELQDVGAYYMNNINTVKYPGHSVLNLRARYSLHKVDVWAAVLNASNTHYAEVAASTYNDASSPYNPDAQNTYTPGAPRTALLGFNYHFGEN